LKENRANQTLKPIVALSGHSGLALCWPEKMKEQLTRLRDIVGEHLSAVSFVQDYI
jgi:hypothetical protein